MWAIGSLPLRAGIPPVEMADAYSTIARIGSRLPLRTIRYVTNDRGKVISTGDEIKPVQVFPARDAFILVNTMKGPIDRGTAALCDGGTLILKEIGSLPMTLQPRILRLLREKEYERHNEFVVRRSDLRVVAATSEDLDQAAARCKPARAQNCWFRLPSWRMRPLTVAPPSKTTASESCRAMRPTKFRQ